VKGSRATVLLKAYYHDTQDRRDRLGAEFAFSRFAWKVGMRSIPQPLAQDTEIHVGLYEFLPGRPLLAGEIDALMIERASSFYQALNEHRHHVDGISLPRASEACFSLGEHFGCVKQRLDQLRSICRRGGDLDQRGHAIITGALSEQWGKISQRLTKRMSELGLDADERLRADEVRLSPSDFGFHNALLTGDGELRFFDFEYGGWDDPAKLVCDFFCQRKVPVSSSHFERFTNAVAADLPRPELALTRIELLMPLFRFKWCCIMLNEFLPTGARRRRFATSNQKLESIKSEQITKVAAALQNLGS
jgi:hypothetical protein